jgi:hypothetical protein
MAPELQQQCIAVPMSRAMKPLNVARPAVPATPAPSSPDLDGGRLRHPHAVDFNRGVEVVEMSDTMAGELLDLFEPPAQTPKRAA